jgi:anti-sigma B factor antagonist
MPLTITSEEGAGIVTIRAGGSLDSTTAPQLEERIDAARAKGPSALVLDLKDLSYISSAGVRVIVATHKAMKGAGHSMALTNMQPQIRRVFEIIMALPSLNVFENTEELDRYLAGLQKKVVDEGGA